MCGKTTELFPAEPFFAEPRYRAQENSLCVTTQSFYVRGNFTAQSFLAVYIGSDHDLLMMTFHLRLKWISKPKHPRLKFDIEKLKDPSVLETFQAMISEKFAPLTIMNNEDADMDSMITTFNTPVTETASEILGKHRQKKKTLGHCGNLWSVRQKKRTEKEKIWTWRILEMQGSEQ